mgnify:CR=1 FL=1
MEQRIFSRIPDKISVKYKVKGEGEEKETLSLDIGGGGVCLILKEKIPLKTYLELTLILPEGEKLYCSLAEIRNQKYNQKEGYYEAGIRFLRMSIPDRRGFIRYIRSKIREFRKDSLNR